MNIPTLYKLTKECSWVTHAELRNEYSAKLRQACEELSEASLTIVPGIRLLLETERVAPGSAVFSPHAIQTAIVESGAYNSRVDAYSPDDDLFGEYKELPRAVQAVLEEFAAEYMEAEEIPSVELLERYVKRFEPFGFTFDYGLSLEPINLRVIRAETVRSSAKPAATM